MLGRMTGSRPAIGGGQRRETYNGNLGRMPIMLQLQRGRAEGSERKKERRLSLSAAAAGRRDGAGAVALSREVMRSLVQ